MNAPILGVEMIGTSHIVLSPDSLQVPIYKNYRPQNPKMRLLIMRIVGGVQDNVDDNSAASLLRKTECPCHKTFESKHEAAEPDCRLSNSKGM